MVDKRQIRSINVGELALSSCALTRDEKSIVVGSWDNNVYIYSIDFGRILDTVSGHDDAVSSIVVRGERLITGGWDSMVRVVECPISGGGMKKSTRGFEVAEHEAEVKCLDVSGDQSLVVSGGMDGTQKKIFYGWGEEGGRMGKSVFKVCFRVCFRVFLTLFVVQI